MEANLYDHSAHLYGALLHSDSQDDAVRAARDAKEYAHDMAEDLRGLDPPPEAERYHALLLETAPDYEAMFAFWEELIDGNFAVTPEPRVDPLGEHAADLAVEGDTIALIALAARPPSELRSYLSAALEIRKDNSELNSFAMQFVMGDGGPFAALLALAGTRGALVEMQGQWETLQPPEQLQWLHGRQSLLLEKSRRELDLSNVSTIGSSPEQLEGIFRLMAEGAELDAAWKRLVLEALSE